MNNYISQLLEKLAEATANPTPETDFGETYEEFEKAMLAIETEEHSLAKDIVTGSYEELPPATMLSDGQMQQLLDAILSALNAQGTGVNFPGDNTPLSVCYSALKEHFKDGFHALPGWNIDFCSGWCPDCAFVDYCKSKDDIWTPEELEKERSKNQN